MNFPVSSFFWRQYFSLSATPSTEWDGPCSNSIFPTSDFCRPVHHTRTYGNFTISPVLRIRIRIVRPECFPTDPDPYQNVTDPQHCLFFSGLHLPVLTTKYVYIYSNDQITQIYWYLYSRVFTDPDRIRIQWAADTNPDDSKERKKKLIFEELDALSERLEACPGAWKSLMLV